MKFCDLLPTYLFTSLEISTLRTGAMHLSNEFAQCQKSDHVRKTRDHTFCCQLMADDDIEMLGCSIAGPKELTHRYSATRLLLYFFQFCSSLIPMSRRKKTIR